METELLRSRTKKVKSKDSKETALPNNRRRNNFGPLPRFNAQRLFVRLTIVTGLFIYIWYAPRREINVLARYDETCDGRGKIVDCDPTYFEEIKHFDGCRPKKCARVVSDLIVTPAEANVLLWLAERGMFFSQPNGGVTIMDMHSGALTYKDTFIDFYKSGKNRFITEKDLEVYKQVRERIQKGIAEIFELDKDKLYLTHPTFFSKLTAINPSNIHDEYWHTHVDKETYESFHYTSLLYLNDYKTDFKGGRFFFVDKSSNMSVEPQKGRVSFFTSGAENPHFVERVTKGERYAITISFTCDKSKMIADPTL